MRHVAASLAVVAIVVASVAFAQSPDSVTAPELTSAFRKSTGDRLVPNRNMSYAGHWKAYDAGVVTIAKKGKYGTFTIYLVTSADPETDVKELLSDSRTGVLGTPGAANIYWEAGTSIHGDRFWMAKKRYGGNVVLTWIGPTYVKKTDKSFKRLHTALLAATRS